MFFENLIFCIDYLSGTQDDDTMGVLYLNVIANQLIERK